MRRWQSCWDHSRRFHSLSRWPGSSGWGHSGHMLDLWRLVDTGTGLWHAGTHSPHAPYTGCVQYPGSYMCTLRGKQAKKSIITTKVFGIQLTRSQSFIFVVEVFSINRLLTPAVASGSVSEIAALADATVWSFSVVQAFLALSSLPVTWIHVWHVYVVVALARLAVPTRLRGVAVITRGTFLTSSTWMGGKNQRANRRIHKVEEGDIAISIQ